MREPNPGPQAISFFHSNCKIVQNASVSSPCVSPLLHPSPPQHSNHMIRQSNDLNVHRAFTAYAKQNLVLFPAGMTSSL